MTLCKAKTTKQWHSASHPCMKAAVKDGYCKRHHPLTLLENILHTIKTTKSRLVELEQRKKALEAECRKLRSK